MRQPDLKTEKTNTCWQEKIVRNETDILMHYQLNPSECLFLTFPFETGAFPHKKQNDGFWGVRDLIADDLAAHLQAVRRATTLFQGTLINRPDYLVVADLTYNPLDGHLHGWLTRSHWVEERDLSGLYLDDLIFTSGSVVEGIDMLERLSTHPLLSSVQDLEVRTGMAWDDHPEYTMEKVLRHFAQACSDIRFPDRQPVFTPYETMH